MNNKLEASLSQNDLNSLFSTKVEKASNNYFYIMTKTHKIYIKNPQITWDQPGPFTTWNCNSQKQLNPNKN